MAIQPPPAPPKNSSGQTQTLLDLMMAEMPEYSSTYDPKTMSALQQHQDLYGKYSQGYNSFRDDALREGPSRWLNMSRAQNALKTQDSREKAQMSMAGDTATAMNNLAASGGLSSGARERVQEQGQKNLMGMSQDLSRQNNLADLQLGVTDEQNRIGSLKDLTGMEETKMKGWEVAKNTDTQNVMAENQRRNQYNMDKYNARMTALGNESQARAMENAGKK